MTFVDLNYNDEVIMRHKQAPKRNILPDPKFNNLAVAKFINYVTKKGKKSIAQRIVYDAFSIVGEKTSEDPMKVFETAIKNISPLLEVKGRRIGGANYQIPIQVRGERKQALTFRWMISAAKGRKGKPMKEKLAEEIISAANNEGAAVKKKQDVQRMAEANRAFAHFARF